MIPSKLSFISSVFFRKFLTQGCGEMPGTVVHLNIRLCGLRETNRAWHNHRIVGVKNFGEQRLANIYICFTLDR